MRRNLLARLATILGLLAATLFLAPHNSEATDRGRIYGKITTADGELLEGFIRWDRNEVCWDDVLDGTIDRTERGERHARRRSSEKRKVKLFGMTVYSDEGSSGWLDQSQSGIAFGHLKSLEPDGADAAILTLKSGETVNLEAGSTDIGADVREILIEDKKQGEVELTWDDISRIDFSAAPSAVSSAMGYRLYGTLTTRRGDEYTGFVTWDIDEVLSTDVLEGRVDDRKRRVRFSNITSIERRGPGGALVTTKDSATLRMEDSNDVDNSNRGIGISDPKLGRVTVEWDEFEKVIFKPAPDIISYDMYTGGRQLKGTVTTVDGDKFTGQIVWDDDERETWEILDGEYRNAEFDIFFGNIATITRDTRTGSTVTLLDGRKFRLRGSNDVDDDNKGIIITTSGNNEEELDWVDVASVNFDKQ